MAPNMKGVFPTFALQQLGPYIAFIVIFVYNVVLGYDLPCSCDKDHYHCGIYMALPIFILLFLQLWMDKTFQRVCKYRCVWTCRGQAAVEGAGGGQAGVEGAGGGQAGVEGAGGGQVNVEGAGGGQAGVVGAGGGQAGVEGAGGGQAGVVGAIRRLLNSLTRWWNTPRGQAAVEGAGGGQAGEEGAGGGCCYSCSGCCTSCCRCKFCLVLCNHLFKAAFISLLWVVAVLIDGDWYVCCQNYNPDLEDLACREKEKNITLQDRKDIAELKSKSLEIGLWLLFSLVAAALLLVLICFCKDSYCCKKSDCCKEESFYYELVLEEEEDVLKEVLTTAAKEKLTKGIKDKLSSDKWTECFDVAEQLIDNKTKPSGAESQETLQLEKLRLEVEKLRAEVQRQEPDTAATGGAGGAAGETGGAAGGTGGTSAGASQEEAIELQTVNTEEPGPISDKTRLLPEGNSPNYQSVGRTKK